MKIKPNEISSLIKEQISHFNTATTQDDVGKVISVGDGIALVYGLEKVMLNELVLFPNNIYGLVLNLEEEHVGVVLLGEAAMLSAQRAGPEAAPMGMNAPGAEQNAQFALNVLHWLAGR